MSAAASPVREPAAVRRRPRFRGYPVPFTVFIDAAGIPDFKVLDQANHRRCVQERLCGICGEPIGRFVCFVGGPKSLEAGQFIDAPMHESCSRYAFAICPFLVGRSEYAQHQKDHGPGVKLIDMPGEQTRRPDRMGLYVTESYRAMPGPDGQLLLQAGPAHRITWIAPV